MALNDSGGQDWDNICIVWSQCALLTLGYPVFQLTRREFADVVCNSDQHPSTFQVVTIFNMHL